MIGGSASTFGLGKDFRVRIVALVILTAIATRLYPDLIN
jgi:hypothetical protein